MLSGNFFFPQRNINAFARAVRVRTIMVIAVRAIGWCVRRVAGNLRGRFLGGQIGIMLRRLFCVRLFFSLQCFRCSGVVYIFVFGMMPGTSIP